MEQKLNVIIGYCDAYPYTKGGMRRGIERLSYNKIHNIQVLCAKPWKRELRRKKTHNVVRCGIPYLTSGNLPFIRTIYRVFFYFFFIISSVIRIGKLNRQKPIDVINPRDIFSGLSAIFCKKLFKIPVVTTIHGIYVKQYIQKITSNKNYFLKLLFKKPLFFIEKYVIKNSDLVMCVSIEGENYYKQFAKKTVYIPNGVDTQKFKPRKSDRLRKEFGMSKDTTIVGAIGRLEPQKGFIYLLEAIPSIVKNYKKIKFLIIGEGYLKKELKAKADKLNINKNIMFTGFRNDLPEILSMLDIYISTSLWEGFSVVIIEAMATKKPIIATAVSGAPQALENDSGILIPPKDPGAIEKNIIKLIKNKKLRDELASNALNRAITLYSKEVMDKNYIKIYKKVAGALK